jgi:hypothetical protein
MTDLGRHAAPQFPTRNLYPHDVPSQSGFMIFETPLATYRNDSGREVKIVTASWGPWNGPAGIWDDGELWLSFYSHQAALFPDGTQLAAVRITRSGRRPADPADNEAG